jgi:hypothetical protein
MAEGGDGPKVSNVHSCRTAPCRARVGPRVRGRGRSGCLKHQLRASVIRDPNAAKPAAVPQLGDDVRRPNSPGRSFQVRASTVLPSGTRLPPLPSARKSTARRAGRGSVNNVVVIKVPIPRMPDSAAVRPA